MLTEVQNRGAKDIFIACVDGLAGLPEATQTVYPREPGAVVYGASDEELLALCLLQAYESGGDRSQSDLFGQYRDGG